MALETAETHLTGTAAPAVRGRSLWGDAWLRLRANRAAMASILLLALIGLACLVGPWLSPHGYDQVYRDYVKVPASLTPYPGPEAVEPALEKALRRARVEIEDWRVDDGRLTVTLSSQRPIDPRNAAPAPSRTAAPIFPLSSVPSERVSPEPKPSLRRSRRTEGARARRPNVITSSNVRAR